MKKFYSIAFIFLIFAFVISGCSAGPSALSGTGGSSDDSGTSTKTASLTISAKFPTAGKAGEIGAALIDQNTMSLRFWFYDSYGNYYDAILNSTTYSKTYSNIVPGDIDLHIETFDYDYNLCNYVYGGAYCNGPTGDYGKTLEHIAVSGQLAEGTNNLSAFLIRGKWDFVNASNNPIALTLNKTYTSSIENATGLSLVPTMMGYGAGINQAYPWNVAGYNTIWKGAGLGYVNGIPAFGYEAYPGAFTGSPLAYFAQFVGPNSSNTALMGGDLNLTPNPTYANTIQYDDPNTYYENESKSNRFAFVFGMPFNFNYGMGGGYGSGSGGGPESFTFSNGTSAMDSINQFATSKVVDSTTISGNISEVLIKSMVGNAVCTDIYGYEGPAGQIWNCPQGFMPAPKKSNTKKAIFKAAANKISKVIVAPNANNCYTNVSFVENDSYMMYLDLNNDGMTQWVQVNTTGYGVADLCAHSFKAKGSQLPATDLNIVIQ